MHGNPALSSRAPVSKVELRGEGGPLELCEPIPQSSRKSASALSNRIGKWYAVRKGLNPGIYTSWSECEGVVKGYPGAEFKSFWTLVEAENFMLGK